MTHAFGQDIAILNEIANENTREISADMMAISEPYHEVEKFLKSMGFKYNTRNMLTNFRGRMRNAFPIYSAGENCLSFELIYFVDRESKTASFVIEPNNEKFPVPEGLEMLKEEKLIHFPRRTEKFCRYYIGRNGEPVFLSLEEAEKVLESLV